MFENIDVVDIFYWIIFFVIINLISMGIHAVGVEDNLVCVLLVCLVTIPFNICVNIKESRWR